MYATKKKLPLMKALALKKLPLSQIHSQNLLTARVQCENSGKCMRKKISSPFFQHIIISIGSSEQNGCFAALSTRSSFSSFFSSYFFLWRRANEKRRQESEKFRLVLTTNYLKKPEEFFKAKKSRKIARKKVRNEKKKSRDGDEWKKRSKKVARFRDK